MSQSDKRERVEAALRGEAVDRVPVSAWRHFIAEERDPEALARISLAHLNTFDWDWLKVNPRATYYAEAWGNRYDYAHYVGVRPRLNGGPLSTAADLDRVEEISPTDGVFAEHLALLRHIQAGIGNVHFVQTVFSPLSVLSFLAARPHGGTATEVSQAQQEGIRRYIHENPQGVHAALANIAATLAGYAAASVDAGASGLFFAIVGLARQGVLSQAEYDEFGRPYDLRVLQVVQGAPFNLLHICGEYAYLDDVTEYPVHAINWAAIGQHNPTLGEAGQRLSQALVGGVDEAGVLQHGTPQQVTEQALAAIQETNGRHLLLTPGCATSVDVPVANLHALRAAASLAATI
jgi:uroporphyrinogen decarboxylase